MNRLFSTLVVLMVSVLMSRVAIAQTLPPLPIIGDDFRVSQTGPDGDLSFAAAWPSVARETVTGRWLAVFQASTDVGGEDGGENEIWGQLLDQNGDLEGPRFQISFMGTTGDTTRDAYLPRVIYNPTAQQFFVVWVGDNGVDDDYEIWGRRISTTGELVGFPIRISGMGETLDSSEHASRTAWAPDIAYDSIHNRYLVVWYGDNLVDGKDLIMGRYVEAAGTAPGSQFVIANLGNSASYNAQYPAVAYGTQNDHFVVVFQGDTEWIPGLLDDEVEVFASVVQANGSVLGPLLISENNPLGTTDYQSETPAVAYNPISHEFMVVWSGSWSTPGEFEIWGRRISGSGTPSGAAFRISTSGAPGDASLDAILPRIIHEGVQDRYMVAWASDTAENGLVDQEYDIRVQLMDNQGAFLGDTIQVSSMGDVGSPAYSGNGPALAFSPEQRRYFIAWWGDDNSGTTVDQEWEIWGQFLSDVSDVSLNLSDGGATMVAGSDLVLTGTVVNSGPHAAQSLSVSVPVQTGTTFVSGNGTGWACTAANPVICSLGSLAVGATSSTLQITFSTLLSLEGSVLSTEGHLTASTFDSDTANNSAANTIAVIAPSPTPTAASTIIPATPTVAPTAANPTPTPAAIVPTATSTPVVRCNLSVEKGCKRAVARGKLCALTTSATVNGVKQGGLSYRLERKLGGRPFARTKTGRLNRTGFHKLTLSVSKTAAFRSVLRNPSCTTGSVRIQVR